MARHEPFPDPHAERRERARRKRRYGMRVHGRSVQTLARLQARQAPQQDSQQRAKR